MIFLSKPIIYKSWLISGWEVVWWDKNYYHCKSRFHNRDSAFKFLREQYMSGNVRLAKGEQGVWSPKENEKRLSH